jgi:hypothetical protein
MESNNSIGLITSYGKPVKYAKKKKRNILYARKVGAGNDKRESIKNN